VIPLGFPSGVAGFSEPKPQKWFAYTPGLVQVGRLAEHVEVLLAAAVFLYTFTAVQISGLIAGRSGGRVLLPVRG
jgi:hypothetical protein